MDFLLLLTFILCLIHCSQRQLSHIFVHDKIINHCFAVALFACQPSGLLNLCTQLHASACVCIETIKLFLLPGCSVYGLTHWLTDWLAGWTDCVNNVLRLELGVMSHLRLSLALRFRTYDCIFLLLSMLLMLLVLFIHTCQIEWNSLAYNVVDVFPLNP